MRNAMAMIVVSALATVGPAGAQTVGFNGADEIARGDFARAEHVIDKSRKILPEYPEMMLNLALVYRHTARNEQARDLYLEVLRRPDQELGVLADGKTARSHAVATAGLAVMGARIASQ